MLNNRLFVPQKKLASRTNAMPISGDRFSVISINARFTKSRFTGFDSHSAPHRFKRSELLIATTIVWGIPKSQDVSTKNSNPTRLRGCKILGY